MNVSVVEVSPTQKKLNVTIPSRKVQDEIEHRYRDLAKRVKIKGFRPGKVPRAILKSYYGKVIENEVSSQFIHETFPEALREADLKPLTEADVSEMNFDDDGSFTYSAVVDVCPPFEIDGYRGLEVATPQTEVEAERVTEELDRIREQHAQLSAVEPARPIREGDMVLIDFVPSVDGVVFEKGKTKDYMLEVGKKSIHPDLDAQIVGRSVGETLSATLDYPEDASVPEIAGKRVVMEVTIRELKEKIVPELNDDFAKEVGKFDTIEDLRGAVFEQLLKRQEETAKGAIRQQIIDQLLGKVSFELPEKVVEREVDAMIGRLQHQFESQGLNIDTSKFNSPEIRAEYRVQAEKNLRQRLVFAQIAKQENIELSDEDLDEIYREVARFARMDLETIKREYENSSIVEQSKEGKIQERVFAFLEESAVFTEASNEAQGASEE